MYGSWDIKCKGQSFLSFWAIFCPKTLLTIQKIKIFKKQKKTLEILSFYTCVSQMKIILCMIPEISNTTDIFLSFWAIFCPFTPLTTNKNSWRYYHFMHEHHKYKFLRYGVCQSIFFLISGYFLPFYPLNSPKNENFKKMEENTWRYFTQLYQKLWL